MTNHHIKLEDPWAMSSILNDRTKFSVYGPSDLPTNQPTCGRAKQYTPTYSKGGIIKHTKDMLYMYIVSISAETVDYYS